MTTLTHATTILSMADDMAACAVAMPTAPQNYVMFIEARDKLKETLKEVNFIKSWSPEDVDRRKSSQK